MPASPARELAQDREKRPLGKVAAIFGSVGIAATLCYFLLATVLAALPGMSVTGASVIAYSLSAALSYYGHKHLSFASKRADTIAIPRFLVSTGIGLSLAFALPKLGESMGWPPIVAYAAICAVVPAINFVVLGRWVFGGRASGANSTDLAPAPLFWTLAALSIVLVSAVAYAFNDWRWGTIPDTSWLITVIERIDAGQRLFVDVIELNPPFSIWLYVLPVRIAAFFDVAPESAIRLYTIAICLAGTALTGWMLASGGMLGRRSAASVAIALFSITVLISGNGFTERDQIGAVLGLPLMLLAAWRALPGQQPSPGALHWLVAGAGGGVLAMVKPYYAIVVVAAACLLALKRRDIRVLFLPEFVLSGAITAAYLALSYTLYPAFFETLLPLLRDTYMAFRQPLDILIFTAVPWLALPVSYAVWRRLINRREPSDFLMAAAIAAWVPYFLQGKAWAYHAYPAVLFGSAALVVGLAVLLEKRTAEPRFGRIVIVSVAILLAHIRFAATEKPSDILSAAGLQEGKTPTVGMLGGAIETGHPLARIIAGRWIEPYCSDWIATYAMRREMASAATGNTAEASSFQTITERYFVEKKARLMASLPQILIVDQNDGLVSVMLDQFGFKSLLQGYDRIAADGGVELYRLRQDASILTPTPAASPASASD